MAGTSKRSTAQSKSPVSQKISEAIPERESMEMTNSASEDVRYLLDQCEALVMDRDSWKQRATDAEKLIAELKMDKQELIRAVTGTLNQS
ncbi:MAG: hypothetical protein V3R87_11025 [Dehalococcoidia bacterium]